jgi:predicted ATPase
MSLKVLFTGTTTSGKTTLIGSLRKRNIPGIAYIEEEARKFLEENPGIERDPQLQDFLFTRQVSAEQRAAENLANIIICDRGVPDNIAHALLFGQMIKDEWREWAKTYDEVFLFNQADINYQQPTELQMKIDSTRDWVKYRQDLDKHILRALQECGLAYIILQGTIEKRLSVVENMITIYTQTKEGGYKPLGERK